MHRLFYLRFVYISFLVGLLNSSDLNNIESSVLRKLITGLLNTSDLTNIDPIKYDLLLNVF